MGILDRVDAVRGKKAWSQPPFWSTDARRPGGFLSSMGLRPDREQIENNLEQYIDMAYKADGPVFSAIADRQRIFSQAGFAWQTFTDGNGGDLWTTDALDLLRNPAPNMTTGELLSRMEAMGSLAGNYFGTTADDDGKIGKSATGKGRRVASLNPAWMTIILGSHSKKLHAPDTKVIAYEYKPPGSESWLLTPDEVCHYSPQPDPAARFRGMSWLTPIIREIQGDKAATVHKERFFKNGAQLSTVIALKDIDEDGFDEFVEKFNDSHQGADNAYKTLFLMGGADVTTLTADLKQLDFKATQGAGETRIAMASGMHPVILGMSEGLAGSSLNEGNFGAARRLVADKTMRHLWGVAAGSLQTLVKRPDNHTRLVPDLRDVAFLREDAKDVADIQGVESRSIRSLVDAGYTAESVIEAISKHDWSRLQHSGLFSVQLQPPGSTDTPTPPEEA